MYNVQVPPDVFGEVVKVYHPSHVATGGAGTAGATDGCVPLRTAPAAGATAGLTPPPITHGTLSSPPCAAAAAAPIIMMPHPHDAPPSS